MDGTPGGTDNGQPVSRRAVLRTVGSTGAAATGASMATGSAQGGVMEDCLTEWPTALDARIDISSGGPTENANVAQGGDLVVFVPGWLNDDVFDSIDVHGATLAAAVEEGLEAEGYTGNVAVAMWGSTTLWAIAKSRADAAGTRLAAWIDSAASRYDSISIIAHSLGTRVALSALNSLSNAQVDTMAILGGAVDPDSLCEEYKSAIEGSVANDVYSYHNEDDGMVCTVYTIREFTRALGCSGTDCSGGWWSSGSPPPSNLVEVDISGDFSGHCGYVMADSMDFSGRNALGRVWDNQLAAVVGDDGGEDDDDDSNDDSDGNSDDDNCWLFCW